MQETLEPQLPTGRRAKFWVGGGIVVLVIAALIVWAMQQPGAAASYVSPTELTKQTKVDLEVVRLAGTVARGSIEQDGLTTTFSVTDGSREISVTTDSPMPDAFKDGSEVTATGTFDGRLFTASKVLAKCPSKFKAKV